MAQGPMLAETVVPSTVAPALRRAMRYLLDQQRPDGSWLDFWVDARRGYPTTVDPKWETKGGSDTWVTAYAGEAARDCDAALDFRMAEAFAHAAAFLREKQRPDGGWGYNDAAPVDCDTISRAILFLAPRGDMDPRAREALLRHQRADGGFSFLSGVTQGTWELGHADVTGLSLQALADIGEDVSSNAARGVDFLLGRREDGGWYSFWHRSPLFATAQAVRGLRCVAPVVHRSIASDALAFAHRQVDSNDAVDVALLLDVELACDGAGAGSIAETLIALQRDDGRWTPRQPVMRVPSTTEPEPWRFPGDEGGEIVYDRRSVHTTATALRALCRFSRSTL